MSTRSAIARPRRGGGFTGRYHHWDGYPSGLGATLYALAQPGSPFDGDTKRLLHVLIDEHAAGWSTINGADWSQEPGFADDMDKGACALILPPSLVAPAQLCGRSYAEHLCQYNRDDVKHTEKYPCGTNYGYHLGHGFEGALGQDRQRRPECYCHGVRSEKQWRINDKNAAGAGCEYAYVIKGRRMLILSSYTSIGSDTGEQDEKMIGFFGMGDADATWKPLADVDLDGPEPTWEDMS